MRGFAKNIHSLTRALTAVWAMCIVLLFAISPAKAEFEYTPIVASVPFTCVGADVSESVIYEFVMECMDASSPAPRNASFTIYGSGTGVFNIDITEPGTYRYKVYERVGTNEKVIYDESVYTVTLFVTHNDDGTLEYQVILSQEEMVKPTEMKFVNSASKKKQSDPMPKTGEIEQPCLIGAMLLIVGASLLLTMRHRRMEVDHDY